VKPAASVRHGRAPAGLAGPLGSSTAAGGSVRHNQGLLPVTENDKLIGMITDRDIAIRGVAEGKGPDAKVRDAMSPEVKYCFEDEDVTHLAENMAELQIRRLPVMNRDKRLVGIISLADLAIEGSLPKTAKALHGISQPGGEHNQSRQST
jgi:CBS-domain-containing membrane protein